MIKTMVDLLELNILYIRDLPFPLANQRIDFYIQEGLDGTYEVYQIPSHYFGYHSDFHNRLAYSFNNLSLENQHMFEDKCRHIVRNGNGSYYEDGKKYVHKKTKF